MSKVSLQSQIAAVQREIGQRQKVYPRLVGKGTLRQSEADLLIEHMRAVEATLLWFQSNETEIRAFVASKREGRS